MKAIITRAEINSLIHQRMKPGLSLDATRIEQAEISLELKVKVLIKDVSVSLKLREIEANGSCIQARLEGLPEWMINFARNQGWLNLPGLRFDGGHLSFDLSGKLPPFVELEAITASDDELTLSLRLK